MDNKINITESENYIEIWVKKELARPLEYLTSPSSINRLSIRGVKQRISNNSIKQLINGK